MRNGRAVLEGRCPGVSWPSQYKATVLVASVEKCVSIYVSRLTKLQAIYAAYYAAARE